MENELTIEEVADLPEETYTLYDIRDSVSFEYGTISKAESAPDILALAENGDLPKGKKLVLFCMHGTQSIPLCCALRELGYDAYSLSGGYAAWLRKQFVRQDRSFEIEDALRNRRKWKKQLWVPFTKAIVKYELVKPNDKIAVCISGGKDSMLMAKLFQELKRHNKFAFDLKFIVMDPGYNDLNRLIIENNAQLLGIPIEVFETSIFDAVDKVEKSPCYLCARMRRGHLYSKAQELGCNKIALGHHFDDVIETTLMGMFWGGQLQGMMPKLHSTNFVGMELIRPMYLIHEDDIKEWRDYHGLHFIQCACHFTDTCSSCRTDGVQASKRMETKLLIRELKKTNPMVDRNIMNSTHNISLDTMLSYKQNGHTYSFLDRYDSKGKTNEQIGIVR